MAYCEKLKLKNIGFTHLSCKYCRGMIIYVRIQPTAITIYEINECDIET